MRNLGGSNVLRGAGWPNATLPRYGLARHAGDVLSVRQRWGDAVRGHAVTIKGAAGKRLIDIGLSLT
jgi:hypothetical protein